MIEKSFTHWHFSGELNSGADFGTPTRIGSPSAISSMHDERKCSRCGSSRTQIMGQSVSPPGTFVRCQDCGHSTLMPPTPTSQKPTPTSLTPVAPPQPQVDKRRIEHLVTTVIDAKMLPHRVQLVEKTAAGWQVTIRTKVGDFVKFEIKADSMSAMRTAVERALAPA